VRAGELDERVLPRELHLELVGEPAQISRASDVLERCERATEQVDRQAAVLEERLARLLFQRGLPARR
jgi:hypothetical protein